MKKIYSQISSYIRANFQLSLYLATAFFVLVALWVNYTFDLEDGIIDQLPPMQRFFGMFLFHSVPYLVICLFLTLIKKESSWYRSAGFWIRLIIGFSILAFDRSLSIYSLFESYYSGIDLYYILRVANKTKSLITMVLPLIIMSLMVEKNNDTRLYGLKTTYFDAKPYFILLGLAGIAIVIGGFFKDIQEFYPRYLEVNGPRFAEKNSIPGWLNMLIYELAYGSDFISVELFFRGFLIVGMVRYLGPSVVLPMIVTYCFLHFGKPLTESVSSLFGGYILGIISLNSKSIWGGVLIHVGIAWLMELVGYIFRALPS